MTTFTMEAHDTRSVYDRYNMVSGDDVAGRARTHAGAESKREHRVERGSGQNVDKHQGRGSSPRPWC